MRLYQHVLDGGVMGSFSAAKRKLLLGLSLGGWALSQNTHAQNMTSGRLRSMEEMLRGIESYPTSLVTPIESKVKLYIPLLADNGNSVPAQVLVDSPMTPTDHVESLYLLSQRNPVLIMAHFHLGPWSGRAEINTRLRLAGSQKVMALAKMSNADWHYHMVEVIATESACVDASDS
jgi:sulfur-oxidizing protein SoxY